MSGDIAPIEAATPLISSKQAAEMLGKTRWTVARLVRTEKLTPAAKVEGQTGAYLFRREDVEALAATLDDSEDGAA